MCLLVLYPSLYNSFEYTQPINDEEMITICPLRLVPGWNSIGEKKMACLGSRSDIDGGKWSKSDVSRSWRGSGRWLYRYAHKLSRGARTTEQRPSVDSW
jgi:hypothetical protein